MNSAPSVIMAAGRAPQPRAIRQPDSPAWAAKKFTIVANTTPTPMNNWKPEFNAPRHFGGAISERYIGAACKIAVKQAGIAQLARACGC